MDLNSLSMLFSLTWPSSSTFACNANNLTNCAMHTNFSVCKIQLEVFHLLYNAIFYHIDL